MKALKILKHLSFNPESANYFGLINGDNNRPSAFVEKMFGKGSLTGRKPEEGETWAWLFSIENVAPIVSPDFIIKADEGGSFFGYIIDEL